MTSSPTAAWIAFIELTDDDANGNAAARLRRYSTLLAQHPDSLGSQLLYNPDGARFLLMSRWRNPVTLEPPAKARVWHFQHLEDL